MKNINLFVISVLFIFTFYSCNSQNNSNKIDTENSKRIMLLNSDFPSDPLKCYPQKDSLELKYKIKFEYSSKACESKFSEGQVDSIITLFYKKSKIVTYFNIEENKHALLECLILDKEIFFSKNIQLGIKKIDIEKIFPELSKIKENAIEITDGSELTSVYFYFNESNILFKLEFTNNDEL